MLIFCIILFLIQHWVLVSRTNNKGFERYSVPEISDVIFPSKRVVASSGQANPVECKVP